MLNLQLSLKKGINFGIMMERAACEKIMSRKLKPGNPEYHGCGKFDIQHFVAFRDKGVDAV